MNSPDDESISGLLSALRARESLWDSEVNLSTKDPDYTGRSATSNFIHSINIASKPYRKTAIAT